MLASVVWDFVFDNIEDGRIKLGSGKQVADAALYLLKNEFAEKSRKTLTLTKKGEEKFSKLSDARKKLSAGIPIGKRLDTVPKSFLLQRDGKTVKWHKGRAGRAKGFTKLFTFMTDLAMLVKGTKLLSEDLRVSKDLYLHFFPLKLVTTEQIDSLILDTYSRKPKLITPFYYQRTRFSSPGVIWMRDVDNALYPMSAVYYDYLNKWTDRIRYEHSFGFVDVDGKKLITLECSSAPSVMKFKGDLVAVVAMMTPKEQLNADMSG
jgi:hypothetical protein